jgi:PIN domain nuclease of toxin-antitoxin system
MVWTELKFGKHSGKTLPQVILTDPDWFFWAFRQGVFEQWPNLSAEVQDLLQKARQIKLPKEGWEIEYLVRRGKLCEVRPVKIGTIKHQGSTEAIRKRVIDLGFAHHLRSYDKMGSKILLCAVKSLYFKDSNRLTKARCEAFFEKTEHFLL